MRKIVYYVATSLDGFIAAKDGSANGFTAGGNGIDQYLEDLKSFDTVIMGRKTYEFGYQYGLQPGQLAYPHMKHHIFSKTLDFEEKDQNLFVHSLNLDVIRELKNKDGTDIYLCGGGALAGWLLEHQQIDILKIKLNPFVMGDGIGLFGNNLRAVDLQLMESQTYDQGLLINTYKLVY